MSSGPEGANPAAQNATGTFGRCGAIIGSPQGPMAPQREEEIAHLFRRAGFGASDAELTQFARLGLLSYNAALGYLLDVDGESEDVDASIGRGGRGRLTARKRVS